MNADCGLSFLARDFAAVRDDLGAVDLAFLLEDGELTVKAWARRLGTRLVPSGEDEEATIRRYMGERGELAKAYYIAAEAARADGSVHTPERGDKVRLFGRDWQIRDPKPVGFGEMEIMALTLVGEDGRGVRSGGI